MKQLTESYEVLVCGGGLAGVCAAIAAARTGASTCIVQDRPVFGGNSSSEIRVYTQGAANYHAFARETGIISELLIEERALNHESCHECGRTNSVWDMVLYDKVAGTPQLVFYLNTSVYAVEQDDKGAIKAVKARIANGETELVLQARTVIDCTGDGIVAHLAGCQWRMGSEAREEFGEPHAPEAAGDDVMGSSILFRAKDVGRPVPFKAPAWAFSYDDPDVFYKGGRIPYNPQGGYWWIELGVPWNTISDHETLRHELTRHVLGIWDFMKNKDPRMKKKTENYALDWIGQVPGKRESRRIMGKYMLTELDLLQQTVFADEVAFGGWYVDLHRPGGLLAEYSEQASVEGRQSEYMKKSYVGPYGIPLRCLLAKDVPNLMLAGRNISVTHAALGSTRVMGTTALLGQAAGTAAAMACRQGAELSVFAERGVDGLKQQLLRDGCFLLHTVNSDDADLARQAAVASSSEGRLEQAGPAGDEELASGLQEDKLEQRRGQWIATGPEGLEAVSVYVSNLTAETQWLEAALVVVEHIWDYRKEGMGELARTRLRVPPGEKQWLRWQVEPSLSGKSLQGCGYVRLELGPHPGLAWHRAADTAPGMPAAYDTGGGGMMRLGSGRTLAFAVEPAQHAYPAAGIVSGVTRPYRSLNMWRSEPGKELPQWLELSWAAAVPIGCVQITFANLMLRDYRFYPPFHRNPECVSDFSLEAWADGQWQPLARVQDNYQTLCKVKLPAPVSASKLRLVVHATNGADSAMVSEIRVYDS
ncbi:FAD-dependent oxidoreductase [Paenibacillus sp. YN15]|uniref:FAD-dependent oxidoreductase n=1 Tax=Paenibacillus sp. YN15 TaxID=1742774 RepID=UPI000DCCDE70|nr:FAD-dependent oxidoreductase [Paenibacillus sp. YN15]RAU92954.1 hypothetical protein DQG13_26675 [Paenibacillus sp. YN15]